MSQNLSRLINQFKTHTVAAVTRDSIRLLFRADELLIRSYICQVRRNQVIQDFELVPPVRYSGIAFCIDGKRKRLKIDLVWPIFQGSR
jgi:hypothetical protein